MIFAPRRKAYLQHWPILLQIVLAHSAILADGLLLRFVNCQIGEKVISDLLVDAAVSVSIVNIKFYSKAASSILKSVKPRQHSPRSWNG